MDRWQQVDKLLEEALEQQPDHRAAFLDEACNGDAALRQEVESLLSAHGKAGDFIEDPALQAPGPASRGAGVRIVAGQQLGPYKILSLLGAGGMGEVYRAKDGRIGREVAIKVLPPAFSADADRLRRFEQEARAAGRLNHPNILVLYDVGTHEGSPYLVSELLQGETLRDRLTRKALPLRKALDYALQMARGLAAAHEKGIVHRDLKPENLFITTDGHLKILDFGLAKLQPKRAQVTDTAVSTETLVIGTEPGVVLGTLGYMSPEQVRGEPTDHRSDIFAFGAILYEMLSGQRAFKPSRPSRRCMRS
jgi:serine/threonine protein kinase